MTTVLRCDSVERLRWLFLCIGAAVAGASLYLIGGEDWAQKAVVLGLMLLGVAWFYAKDHEVDNYRA